MLPAKIPCDYNSNPTLVILTVSGPNLQTTELDLIQDLSTPGELCLYYDDLAFEEGGIIIKDKAIQNPGKVGVVLPARSAVVIDVNKIMPDIEEHRHRYSQRRREQPAATTEIQYRT